MNSVLLLGLPGGWEVIFVLVFFLIPGILWLWAIIDLIQSNFADSNNKILWALLIILVPFIGSILYLIIGRQQKLS